VRDLLISAPIAPHAKGRPRTAIRGGSATVYTPKATKQWETALLLHAIRQIGRPGITEPVRVDCLFVLARPKRIRKSERQGLLWAPVRPDVDNLRKAVLDALSPLWTDDALVVCGDSLKCYAEAGEAPRVVIRIRAAGEHERAEVRAVELGLLEGCE